MDTKQQNHILSAAFRTFLENSPDMIFVKDTELVYLAASQSFADLVHFPSGKSMIGKTDFDFFPQALAEKYTQDDRNTLHSGKDILDYIEPLPDKDGKHHYSSTSKHIIRDGKGTIIGLYGIARDVTAQVELEAERESSRLSREMFSDVLEADLTQNRMLRVEGSMLAQMLRIPAKTSFSHAVSMMAELFVHPNDLDEFLSRYQLEKLKANYLKGEHDFHHILYIRVHPDRDEYLWVEFDTRVYHSRVSDTLRITTFLKNVDAEVRNRQRLQREADIDALTGLYNRASVLRRIATCIDGAESQKQSALLFIDLDGFKQANDTWGHRFGDQVLQQAAGLFRTLASPSDILGRVGGDEFLIFIPIATSRDEVEKKALLLIQSLSVQRYNEHPDFRMTCSIGIALCMGNTAVATCYDHADRAMYRAKNRGRNQCCFYEDC